MCTWIIEKAEMEGLAKGPDGWFKLAQANVYYDHPFHAPLDHALTIDFLRDPDQAGGRVAVELDVDSARRLVAAIEAALETGYATHVLTEEAAS